MQHFELWLDESGDFLSDRNSSLNPSLVGGVLIEKSKIDDNLAKHIVGKKYAHFNNESVDYSLRVLQDIKDNKGIFVIFHNQERVLIVDQDTTYLNILAEGIIQLLLKLSAMKGDFSLDIIIATRKNMVSLEGIIPAEEYEKRLRERVVLGLARKILTRKNRWKYNIKFDDARISHKLMLADAVCNTYLTRTANKFNHTQKQLIENLYSDSIIFSLFENSTEKEILRWIAEGNISEALFEIYINPEVDDRKAYLEGIIQRLKDYDAYGRKNKLLGISAMIEAYIKINQDYKTIKQVLINMQDELLPMLRENDLVVTEFFLDIILYLYTIYTHEGSIKAEEQDRMFLAELSNVTDIVVKFQYFHIYKIRRGIHQKNMLSLDSAIDDLTQAIDVLKEMVELLEILNSQEQETVTKYELLGKALGSRGQAYTMLIHQDQSYTQLAAEDFNAAMEHFTLEIDKERQYVYLSQAYCEAGRYKDALWALCKSCGLEFKDMNDLSALMEVLSSSELKQVIYKYYSYIKIMAYAKEQGQHEIADEMYAIMNKYQVNIESFKNSYTHFHPLQLIYWYMSCYYFQTKGKEKLARGLIDTAIKLCDAEGAGLTIKIMQLGMYAQLIIHYLKSGNSESAKRYMATLKEKYEQIKTLSDVPSILQYIDIFKEQSAETCINVETLEKLMRTIKGLS